MKKRLLSTFVGLSMLSGSLFATTPLEQADELFKKRGESVHDTQAAIDAYKALLDGLTEGSADLVHAVSQLGRLYHLQGEMRVPESRDEKKAIFSECLEVMDYIKPSTLDSDEDKARYYYFYLTCKGYHATTLEGTELGTAVAGYLWSISRAKNFVDTSFEGGGLARVIAGIYVSDTAKDKLPVLFKPKEALALMQKAFQRGEFVDRAYSKNLKPGNFYGNHFVMARCLHFVKEKFGEDEIRKILADDFIQQTLNNQVDPKAYLGAANVGVIAEIDRVIRRATNPRRDTTGGRLFEAKYQQKRIIEFHRGL